MKLLKDAILGLMLAGFSVSALAANGLVNDTSFGALSIPTSVTYGNTFTVSQNIIAINDKFFDAYHFSILNGAANSVTTSIDFANFSGLSNLRARIYSGLTNDVTSSIVSNVEGWSTAFNPNPGVTVQTVVLNPINLVAGDYTLQIIGNVSGPLNGSYAGVLNIASALPVPETESYVMFLGGLGLMGAIARRRKIS
jgi:hypothetical protein